MNVLLSHINEETQVASILKQWIESSLDRDVHLSGEAASVQLDEQRLAEVNQSLGEARVVLLLCSARSIGRPWINFESACAWFKRVPVIAVCHAGCSPADLPPPLGSFPACDLTDAVSCQSLLETLAEQLQKKRVPRIDYGLMVDELSGAVQPGGAAEPITTPEPVARPTNGASGPVAEPPRRVRKSAKRASRAKTQRIEVRLLATMNGAPEFSCTAAGLAAGLGEQEQTVRECLRKLVNNQLLVQKISTHPSDPETRYAFTDAGQSYLAKYHG